MNVETTLIFIINVTRTDDDLSDRRSSRFLPSLFFVFVFVFVYLLFVTFLTFQDTINHLKAQNTELQEILATSENPDSMEPSGTESRFSINTFLCCHHMILAHLYLQTQRTYIPRRKTNKQTNRLQGLLGIFLLGCFLPFLLRNQSLVIQKDPMSYDILLPGPFSLYKNRLRKPRNQTKQQQKQMNNEILLGIVFLPSHLHYWYLYTQQDPILCL